MRPACSSARWSSAPRERRPHEPASLAQGLDGLDCELPRLGRHADTRPHAARGAHERLPQAVVALLEQQHLASAAARPPNRDARAQHAAAVGDHEVVRIEQVDQLGEAAVLDRAVAPVHEQARTVPALGGPLRDQLLGQRVVELVDTHPGSLAGAPAVIGAATDEALARRAAAGQREAFEELVRRHRSRVFALALRICRNPDDAEDALQETFIAALPRAAALRRPGARFDLALPDRDQQVLRHRGAAPSDGRRRSAARGGRSAATRSPAAGRPRQLTRALDGLPEQFREAALLCDVCGLTPAEAGEVAGVPEGTMKSRSFRARALLAVALRAGGAEPTTGGGV